MPQNSPQTVEILSDLSVGLELSFKIPDLHSADRAAAHAAADMTRRLVNAIVKLQEGLGGYDMDLAHLAEFTRIIESLVVLRNLIRNKHENGPAAQASGLN